MRVCKKWNVPIQFTFKILLIMQNKLWKIMFVLIIIQTSSWTAHSQHLRPANKDSVTISRSAQRLCVDCFEDAKHKDSIIVQFWRRVELKDSIIAAKTHLLKRADLAIHDLDEKLSDRNVEIIDLERKKKRRVKWAAGIGFAGGGILGWLIGTIIK